VNVARSRLTVRRSKSGRPRAARVRSPRRSQAPGPVRGQCLRPRAGAGSAICPTRSSRVLRPDHRKTRRNRMHASDPSAPAPRRSQRATRSAHCAAASEGTAREVAPAAARPPRTGSAESALPDNGKPCRSCKRPSACT